MKKILMNVMAITMLLICVLTISIATTDTTAPVAKMNDSVIYNASGRGTQKVSITASDEESGISNVVWVVDYTPVGGTTTRIVPGVSTGTTQSYNVSLKGMGTYEVSCSVVNGAGISTDIWRTATTKIVTDTTAPVAKMNDSVIYNASGRGTQKVSITASDAESGIKNVVWAVDYTPVGGTTTRIVPGASTGTRQSYNVSLKGTGTYVVSCSVVNGAGISTDIWRTATTEIIVASDYEIKLEASKVVPLGMQERLLVEVDNFTKTPLDFNNVVINWKSSSSKIALVKEVRLNAYGKEVKYGEQVYSIVGVITGLKEGTANIIAKLPNGQEAKTVVTVKKETLSLSETTKAMNIGAEEFVKLNFSINPWNLDDVKTTWTSSNPEVAVVDEIRAVKEVADEEGSHIVGTISAKVNALTTGTAIITVNLKTGEKASFQVRVGATETGTTASDTTAPIAKMNDSVIYNASGSGTQKVSITASDAESGISNVVWVVDYTPTDGTTTRIVPGLSTGTTQSYNVPLEGIGTYEVSCTVVNGAGISTDIWRTATTKIIVTNDYVIKLEASKVVPLGMQERLLAEFDNFTKTGLNLNNVAINWESSDTNIALVKEVRLNKYGKEVKYGEQVYSIVGVVTGLKEGTANIIAKLPSGQEAKTVVTVKEKTVWLSETTKAMNIGAEGFVKLSFSINPWDLDDVKTTWTSSNPKVATVGEIRAVKAVADEEGIHTVGTISAKVKALAIGTTIVTVKLRTGEKACFQVKVVEAGEDITAPIAKMNDSIIYNTSGTDTQKVSITASDVESGIKNVIWFVDYTPVNETTRRIVSLHSTGETQSYDVPLEGAGTYVVACSVVNGADIITDIWRVETTKIIVEQEELSIKLTEETKAATVGEEFNVSIKFSKEPWNLDNIKTTWISSNPEIATVDEVRAVSGVAGEDGTFRIVGVISGRIKAVSEGTTTITVKLETGETASCVINVVPIKLTEETKIASVGEEFNVSIMFSREPWNLADVKTEWISSNPEVATVEEVRELNGVVAEDGTSHIVGVISGKIKVISEGTTTITVNLETGETASCVIKVEPIKLTEETKTVNVREEFNVSIKFSREPWNLDDVKTTWISSNPEVATVDEVREVRGVVEEDGEFHIVGIINGNVKALSAGTTTITAKLETGETASMIVNVLDTLNPPTIEKNTITVRFHQNLNSSDTTVVTQTFTLGTAGNRFGYNNDGTPMFGTLGQFGNWNKPGYTLLGWSYSDSAYVKDHDTYSYVFDDYINYVLRKAHPSQTIAGEIDIYAVWAKNIDLGLFWGQSNMVGSAGILDNEKLKDNRNLYGLIDSDIISQYKQMNYVSVPVKSGTAYQYKLDWSSNGYLEEITKETKILGQNMVYANPGIVHYTDINTQNLAFMASLGTNMIPQFAKTYNEETGHDLVTVMVAYGGREISNFLPHNDPENTDVNNSYIYEAMKEYYLGAVEYLETHGYKINNKFYVAYQGCSDATAELSAGLLYYNKFMKMHNNLKKDLNISFGAIVETGGSLTYSDIPVYHNSAVAIRNQQYYLINNNNDIILGSAFGYNAYLYGQKGAFCLDANESPYNFDNSIHLTSAALSQIGKEAAKSIAEKIK